jgi:hypothetical protein
MRPSLEFRPIKSQPCGELLDMQVTTVLSVVGFSSLK